MSVCEALHQNINKQSIDPKTTVFENILSFICIEKSTKRKMNELILQAQVHTIIRKHLAEVPSALQSQ